MNPVAPVVEKAQERPAETGSLVGWAIAFLIAMALRRQDDGEFILALTAVVAALPAGITWIVNLRRKASG